MSPSITSNPLLVWTWNERRAMCQGRSFVVQTGVVLREGVAGPRTDVADL